MQDWRKHALLPILLSLAMTAGADETESTTAVEPGEPSDQEISLEVDELDIVGALSDEELNSHRAREKLEVEQITLNDQNQDGEVTDNVAVGNTNGDNLINGNAFSESSGFLSTVQNTGNNVLIQNSTIINVSVDSSTN